MKWVVQYSLLVMFFGVLSGHKVPKSLHHYSATYSMNTDEFSTEKISDFNSLLLKNDFFGFEIEEEEEERYFSNDLSFTTLFCSSNYYETGGLSFIPPPRNIKLFELYHAWKIFFHV